MFTSVALRFQQMRRNRKRAKKGCINKQGNCKARFPRQIFEETQVDPKNWSTQRQKGVKSGLTL